MSTAIHKMRSLYRDLKDTRILNYAAQLSYGLMLAFLPMLMIFNWAVNTFLRSSNLTEAIRGFADTYLPKMLADLVNSSLQSELLPGTNILSSVFGNIALLFFIFYASARLLHALMLTLTKLLGQKEDRGFIKLWVLSFKYLFLALVLVSLTLYVYLESRVIIVNIFQEFNDHVLANFVESLFNRLTYFYIFIVVFATINWAMAKLPAEPFSFFEAIPGTIAVLLGFILLTVGVHYYNEIMSYEGVIVVVDQGMTIIITVYLISLNILLGELINQRLLDRPRKRHGEIAAGIDEKSEENSKSDEI